MAILVLAGENFNTERNYMNYSNFENHLQELRKQIYNEPHSYWHTKAAEEALTEYCKDLKFTNVLELGCGTAPCLDLMKKWGKETLGITLGNEIVNHEVLREDIHFTSIPSQSFDMIIARHILEHSPMPLILLMEMRRIARKYAYVALPVPDPRSIQHPNHYSVFEKINWEYLFYLSKWRVLRFKQVDYCIEPTYTYREYRYLLNAI